MTSELGSWFWEDGGFADRLFKEIACSRDMDLLTSELEDILQSLTATRRILDQDQQDNQAGADYDSGVSDRFWEVSSSPDDPA